MGGVRRLVVVNRNVSTLNAWGSGWTALPQEVQHELRVITSP